MLWCKVLFLLTLEGCGGIDIYGNRKGGRRPEHSIIYSEETFDHRVFLKLGIIVPHTQWLERKRRYLQIISSSLSNLDRNVLLAINESYRFEFSRRQELRAPDDSINFDEVVAVSPPPRDILDLLCDQIRNSSAAIIYLTDTERYGRSTASSQYFLQLAAYLGIPVIAWNPDNSGLEKRTFQDGQKSIGKLQLAPTIEHQVSAMLSILVRYNWHQFGIVTSEIAGHDDFVQTFREKIPGYQDTFRFIIQDVFKLTESKNYTVEDLAKSEVRIFLLYSTQREAELIMQKGAAAGLTGSNYLWIVTQSVVGDPKDKVSLREKFPIGMLGIHFIVDLDTVLHHIVPLAVQIFSYGAMSLVRSN
ncbi:glutamate receptor ionotropic, NMDA 2B [Eurytemora carolleeae]|uniref:glutamate receptor ionotropic, NMDA 2B n=1 Tax=Eurytemora carolleeae TaxID=1294199 RepID=UPI000C76FB75|nr:glutamate receptor ionotropic, NMDA 2B [Eurytemora carolleeae]|eukprot:XP_023347028.1 glutamate receptor ionotropic, NMDA 2B-like [Eurytemora affinis]